MKNTHCNHRGFAPAPSPTSRQAATTLPTSAGWRALAAGACGVVMLISLAGCSGMSSRGQDTAVGAGAGAVAGAVLTGGSAVGTVGGAVVGGVIGDSVGKK